MNSDLLRRALSAVVFCAAFLLAIYYGERSLFLFFSLIILLGVPELGPLLSVKNKSLIFTATAFSLVFFILWASPYLDFCSSFEKWLCATVLLLAGGLYFLSKLPNWSDYPLTLGASVLYLICPLGVFLAGGRLWADHFLYFALFPILIVWINDTFAYLLGRQFGKRPIFPKISPNKTWEGTILGGTVAILVAAALAYYFDVVIWKGLLMGLICILGAVFGDYFESFLKRKAGVKDSGNIMPGHGGILDRMDAFLFAAPFYTLICVLIQPWG